MHSGLVEEIGDPTGDRLHLGLGPLALEEREHVVVSEALGRLGVELTGDLDDGLDPRAVDLDPSDAIPALPQRGEKRRAREVLANLGHGAYGVSDARVERQGQGQPPPDLVEDLVGAAIPQDPGEALHARPDDAVGLPDGHFVWTNLAEHVAEHVRQHQRAEAPDGEVQGVLEARAPPDG